VADRYYLINLGATPQIQANRIAQIRANVPDNVRRALAHQRLHWRRSVDGQWLMAQADTDDAEHAAMLDRAWVTAGGTANQARAYLNANAAAWGDSSDV
jgi:hypothetical protein